MKKITTNVAEFAYSKSERVLRVKLLENAEIELEDAVQNMRTSEQLTQGDRFLVLVDARATVTVSKEAREFAARQSERDGRIAEAFVVSSLANKLVGNFYINFNKPQVPTKIFSTEEKAMLWLQSHLYLTERGEGRALKKEYAEMLRY